MVTTKVWCLIFLGFFLGVVFITGCGGGPSAIAHSVINALDVDYDNTTSGLTSTNMQAAMDEMAAEIAVLQSQVSTLSDKTASMTTSADGTQVYFTDVNVHVRSGSGATYNAINSRGNLIVGYNENAMGFARSGSHNLIVGYDHDYSGYGGVVFGRENRISNEYATVTGGRRNIASGRGATVSGGYGNLSSSTSTSVSGGQLNVSDVSGATVSGGINQNTFSMNDHLPL